MTTVTLFKPHNVREQVKLKWINVAYTHGWLGHIYNMQEACKKIGYPLFCFNGRIYMTHNLADTGFEFKDVK